ncbi:glutaredoxin-like protein [Dehalogenimonas sp. WBC-2]|nr:glutaredoxin-like protein [Dehalogenimonas sp. WBC-2]
MKGFLSQRGIHFTEVDVSTNAAAAQELVRRTGQMAVPVTDIDGNLVVGFDQRKLEHYISQAKNASAPSLGASVADAEKYTAAHGMTVSRGAYIGGVKQGLSAAKAGLKTGDIITKIDSTAINTAADLDKVIGSLEKGARLKITFIRDGQPRQTEGLL